MINPIVQRIWTTAPLSHCTASQCTAHPLSRSVPISPSWSLPSWRRQHRSRRSVEDSQRKRSYNKERHIFGDSHSLFVL